jgi:hypothetical protein
VPFSDKEDSKKGNTAKRSGSFVAPGLYECNRKVLNDKDKKIVRKR